jgi:hypothetical protein
LEDKRKRDAEVATIKQEIADCASEITDLSSKLEKLKIKEQELTLIEGQLQKELVVNENEIINGLYEIIIINAQDDPGASNEFSDKLRAQAPEPGPAVEGAEPAAVPAEKPLEHSLTGRYGPHAVDDATEVSFGKRRDLPDILEEFDHTFAQKEPKDETEYIIYRQPDKETPSPYPKSVVKTTKGRVVGEYYYDAKVYKNKRHYIFNSKFFLEQLSQGLVIYKTKRSESVYTELLQMIQDAYKRIAENPSMHFEIATNEILNDKTIKDLWNNVKTKNVDDAARFCKRLHAKIAALGPNYSEILTEQMQRYVGP